MRPLHASLLARRDLGGLRRARVLPDQAPLQYRPVTDRHGCQAEPRHPNTELVTLEWGLVPVWAKDTTIGYRLANALKRPIHDRMPVNVPPEKYRLWLDPTEHSLEILGPLFMTYDDGELVAFPVSTFVNSPKHDGPECIKPLAINP